MTPQKPSARPSPGALPPMPRANPSPHPSHPPSDLDDPADGYLSDVAMSDASADPLAAQYSRAIEQTFRDRYSVLRGAYEARIKAMQEAVSSSLAALCSDELVQEMRQDKTSSAFIPAHISELMASHLEGERERYLHSVLQQQASLEADLAKGRDRQLALANKVSRLEEACASGRRAELSMEPLQARVADLQQDLAEQTAAAAEILESLRRSHAVEASQRAAEQATLQAAHDGLLVEHEEATQRLATTLAVLQDTRAQLSSQSHQVTERERDMAKLESSFEQTSRDLAAIEAADRHEREIKAEMKAQLEKLVASRDTLVAEVHSLSSQLLVERQTAASLQQQLDSKIHAEVAMQAKVGLLMRQMQDIVAAEGAEAEGAIAAMQEKLVSTRERLTQELAREKRMVAALSEDLSQSRTAKVCA